MIAKTVHSAFNLFYDLKSVIFSLGRVGRKGESQVNMIIPFISPEEYERKK